MIKSLYLKNFALFKENLVNFEKGLNIITGETGSGKSLLLKSLKFLSGERFSKDFIRENSNRCVLEVEYDCNNESIFIRRVFHSDGKSRTFLNDEPISIEKLKDISENLLDYHGQHENQKLFKPTEQLKTLDQFSGITNQVLELNSIFKSITEINKEIETLNNKKQKFLREQEIIEFQLNEISQIQFEVGDDIELTNKVKKISHQAEIKNKLNDSSKLLKMELFDKLNQIRRNVDFITNLDNDFKPISKRMESIICELEDLSFDIEKELNQSNLNPSEVQELNEKLSVLEMLKRKYGGSLEAVIEYQNQILVKIQNDSSMDKKLSELKNEKNQLEKQYGSLSKEISKKRKQHSKKLVQKIENNLNKLGMENTKFHIELSNLNPDEFFPYGNDKCQFQIASNKSGDLRLLNKIASGGELSRIQLAIKMLKLNTELNESVVFDEIDTGISGKIAAMTGGVMKEISRNQQVLCITHLPQIAGKGEYHFVPTKIYDNSEVKIQVNKLSEKEKIDEIASLMSGEKITKTSKDRAKEILKVQ